MVKTREEFLDGITVLDKDGSGTVTATSARITDLSDPINSQDAVTKAYLDNDGYEERVHGTVTSTDNSGDEIDIFTPGSDDTVIYVEGVVIARDQTDGSSAGWKISAVFERTSSVVSQVGSASIHAEDREDATWTVDMSTDGTDITVDVVGDAVNSVDWRFVGIVVEGP